MTRSVYVVGGAGAGKSTFMEELMADMASVGPLQDLYSLRNKKALVTLRGHALKDGYGRTGMYLGKIREWHPGTDGLDRASSPVGEAWLEARDLPDFIIGEGATLATTRFLSALARTTDLLLIHLYVDPVIADLRFLQRGTSQDPSFVEATRTRSANRFAEQRDSCFEAIEVDTDDSDQWKQAMENCKLHLID